MRNPVPRLPDVLTTRESATELAPFDDPAARFYIDAMRGPDRRRRYTAGRLAIALAVSAGGCGSDRRAPATAVDLFVPTAMRIHPIFTQVADLTGEGQPNGIEAQLEFTDQFGDPTKAAGQVLFEVYAYQKQPPYTGREAARPYVASLATVADERERWNKTLRTYRFPLAVPALAPGQDYVVRATFEQVGGGRLFDKLTVTGRKAGGGKAGDGAAASPLGL